MPIASSRDTNNKIAAPAKVNLALHVTGQRDDGRFLFESLVVFGGAADQVTFKPASHLHLSVHGPFADGLQQKPDNLMVRAAKMLATELNLPAHANLKLEKRLPISAGLGGGSADAAATLLGLLQLWQRTVRDDKLRTIALELGSDVPMCLEGSCLIASGIGDDLQPGPRLVQNLAIVLVNPRVPIVIAEVFKALRQKANGPLGPIPSAFLSAAALADWLGEQRNDLEMAAIEQAPVIEKVLQALGDQPNCLIARMSGAGASCYGLFPSLVDAENAARRLSFSRPQWWVSHGPAC